MDQRDALNLLNRHWGHPAFRPGQWDVIERVLAGGDVLAVLPTGTGKSLCYQLPALLTDGLTLVVSPLIALMRDQVDGLAGRGISATFIDSTLPAREIDQRMTDAEFGKYRLLYVAPERLVSDRFVARAGRLNIRTVVVDEAHCVSEWGHSFRPSYLKISDVVDRLGRPVVMALTATATPRVRKDIASQVGLKEPLTVVTGFDRPNIEWEVYRETDKRRRTLALLGGERSSAIVYAGTRRGVEEWSRWLQSKGITAVHYHGGMAPDLRGAAQSEWMTGRAAVMVATNAFGMGIDKSDVRTVIHVDLPLGLEAYYQEAGRAGRDGLRSRAVLLYRDGDDRLPRRLIDSSYPTAEQVARVYDAACNLGQVAIGALGDGPLDVVASEVVRVSRIPASALRQAVEVVERTGAWATLPSQDRGLLRLISQPESLRTLVDAGRPVALRQLVEHILRRRAGDLWRSWGEVNVASLARQLGSPEKDLEEALRYLDMSGHVSWRGAGEFLRLVLTEPRHRRAPVQDRLLAGSRRSALQRLDDLLAYVRQRGCRRNFILTYFGQETSARCGSCDNCMSKTRSADTHVLDDDLMKEILAAAASGVEPSDWLSGKEWPLDQIDTNIEWLLREGFLRVVPSSDFAVEITSRGKQWITAGGASR